MGWFDFEGQRERRTVIGLLLVGLLLRLGFALAAFGGQYDPYVRLKGDTVKYLAIGMSLSKGEGYSLHYRSVLPDVLRGLPATAPPAVPTANRSPGYPLFLAAVFSTLGHDLRALVLLQAILSSLTPLFVYLTARELKALPILALSFAVFYYPFAFDPIYIMSDWAFTLVTAGMLWLLVRPRSELLGGMAAGVSVLVKSVTLPFLLLVPLIPGRRGWRLLFGLLGVLGPWAYRNYLHTGVPYVTSDQGGYTLFLLHNAANRGFLLWHRPGDLNEGYSGFQDAVREVKQRAPLAADPVAREYLVDRELFAEGLRFIRADPLEAVRAGWGSLLNTWRLDYPGANWIRWTSNLLLYAGLLPFALLGGIQGFRSGPQGARLLALFLLCFVSVNFLFASEIRYRVAAMPAFFVLAAFGISVIGGRIGPAASPSREEAPKAGASS